VRAAFPSQVPSLDGRALREERQEGKAMRAVNLTEMPDGFMVLAGNDRSQAATMVLQSHGQNSSLESQHAESDQWLLVLSGTGRAIVAGEEVRLRPGLMLLIEAGEPHEIRSDSEAVLRTVNIFSPPAFR